MRLPLLAKCALLTVLCTCAFHAPQAAPRDNDEDIWGRPYQEMMDAWAETWDVLAEGRWVDAEARARYLLAVAEARYGSDEYLISMLLDLLVESMLQGGRAHDQEALEFATRAVAMKRLAFGPESSEVVRSLVQQAYVLRQREESAEAQGVTEQALMLLESSGQATTLDAALVCNCRCEVLYDLGHYEEAVIDCQRAIDIRTGALGSDHAEVGDSIGNLGRAFTKLGRLGEAREQLETAIAISQQALGADHPQVAGLYTSYGLLLYRSGEYRDALDFTQRAFALHEQAFGSDYPGLGGILNNLGFMYGTLGYRDEASEAVQRAAEIYEATYGPKSTKLAVLLGNAAVGIKAEGDYVTARKHNQRALEIFEENLGPDDPRVGWILNNYGSLLWELGDYEEAQRMWDRSVSVLEDSMGPQSSFLGSVLLGISKAYQSSGRLEDSRAACTRSLGIAEHNQGPRGGDVAAALRHLATIELSAGNLQRAEALCRRAIEVRGTEMPVDYEVLRTLADIKLEAGDIEAAHDIYDQAATAALEVVVPAHPAYASALVKVAEADLLLGDVDSALRTGLRAEEITRSHLRLNIASFAERDALRYATVAGSGLSVALSALAGDPRPGAVEATWNAVIQSRALVLDEMGGRHRAVTAADDVDTLILADELATARKRLATLTVAGPGAMPPSTWRELLDEAARERDRAERDLADASLAFRTELTRTRVGLAEVSRSLPPGSTLVAYSRFPAIEVRNGAVVRSPSYLAFVLEEGGVAKAVPLGSAAEIDDSVRQLRSHLAAIKADPSRVGRREDAFYRKTGEAIRRTVWDPVVPHVGRAETVFIVPDGALNLINFSALPVGERSYLVDLGKPIWYLSAEREIAAERPPSPGRGLLALGDAAFDDPRTFASLRPIGADPPTVGREPLAFRGPRSACGEFRSLSFDPLYASAEEVESVVAIWSEGGAGRPEGDSSEPEVVLLSGSEATEAAVKSLARGRRVLHLATHGFFLGGNCRSRLDLDEEISVNVWAVDNPLVLSGLALAGANHRASAGTEEEDGILTAEEISALDLSTVDWAVLSACDTGLGEVRAGEGVLGLRRALKTAGARSLVMSLWEVEDESSRDWMTRLYEQRFVAGMSTVDSVHNATLRLLEKRRQLGLSTHPFFWAGFIASGDWR